MCRARDWIALWVGGLRPPPPVAAPLASSLRAPSRGDPPLNVRAAYASASPDAAPAPPWPADRFAAAALRQPPPPRACCRARGAVRPEARPLVRPERLKPP